MHIRNQGKCTEHLLMNPSSVLVCNGDALSWKRVDGHRGLLSFLLGPTVIPVTPGSVIGMTLK